MKLPNISLVCDWLKQVGAFVDFEAQINEQTELLPQCELKLLQLILVRFYAEGYRNVQTLESEAELHPLLDKMLRELLEIPATEQGNQLVAALKIPWCDIDSLNVLEMLQQEWLTEHARRLILRDFCQIYWEYSSCLHGILPEVKGNDRVGTLRRIGYFSSEKDWRKSDYFSRMLETGIFRQYQKVNLYEEGHGDLLLELLVNRVFYWFKTINVTARDAFLLFLEALPLKSFVDLLCARQLLGSFAAWVVLRAHPTWFFAQINRLKVSEESARVADVLRAAATPCRFFNHWKKEFKGLRILVESGYISEVVEMFRSKPTERDGLFRPATRGLLFFIKFLHHLLDRNFFDQAITLLELSDNLLEGCVFTEDSWSAAAEQFFDLVVKLFNGNKTSQVVALLEKKNDKGIPLCHRMLNKPGIPPWLEPLLQAPPSAEELKLLKVPDDKRGSLAERVFMLDGRVSMGEFSKIRDLSQSAQLSVLEMLMRKIPDINQEEEFAEFYSLLIEKILGAVKKMLEEDSGREQEARQRLAELNFGQVMDVLVAFKLGTPAWRLLTDILACLQDYQFLSVADREALTCEIFLFDSFQIVARFLSLLSESERQGIVKSMVARTKKEEAYAQAFAHAIFFQTLDMTDEKLESTYQECLTYVLLGGETVPDIFKAMGILDARLVLKIVLLFVQVLVKQFEYAPSALKLWVDLAVKCLVQRNSAFPADVEEKETRAAILDETACAMLLFPEVDLLSKVRVMDGLASQMPGARSVQLMQSLSIQNRVEEQFRHALFAALATTIELPFERVREMLHFIEALAARRANTPVLSLASLVSLQGLLGGGAERGERSMVEEAEEGCFEQAAGRGGARFY